MQDLFAVAYWLALFAAAVLCGSFVLWLLALVHDIRLSRERARRDREERERMESLRRMADWDWYIDPWKFEWSVRDDIAHLDVREPRRVLP